VARAYDAQDWLVVFACSTTCAVLNCKVNAFLRFRSDCYVDTKFGQRQTNAGAQQTGPNNSHGSG
jgi:hypothetical protein